MIFSRLPKNAQRPTLNAQRSTSERLNSSFLTPNSSFRRHSLRSGMTMIELVAALALFVVILGALLTIMNTATSLWSTARGQQREQAVGRQILDLLTDDLQHAVTDAPSNGVSSLPPPTFILDTRTNQTASGVQIVLQFARHAKRQTFPPAQSGTPLSLDAVFYTYFDNALFRHAIPLSVDYADPKTLGKLLDDQRPDVESKPLHEDILKYVRDPTRNPPPAPDWSFSLLAERIDLLDLPATLPEAFARKPKSKLRAAASTSATGFYRPPQYNYLETDVLPDRIDVALRLHSAEDWATLQRLQNDSSAEADRTQDRLGLRFSKQITFPAQGGSRLP